MTSFKKINNSDKKIWLKAIDAALKGKLKQSITLYEQLLIKYSEDKNLNYELSMLYVKEEKYQNAYFCMEKIFEDFQGNINYLNDFSVVCTKLSYLEKAEYLSKKAFEIEPNNSTHLINLGAIYNLMEKYDDALKVIEHAIQINPIESKYYNMMGATLVKNGLDSVAKKMFEVACALDANYIEAKVNLAVLISKHGDHFTAIKLFEEALLNEIENNFNSSLVNQIKYFLSFDYLSTGRLREGWSYYDFGFDLNIAPISRRNPIREFKKPKWDGRIHSGKTLLIWREQGIGDEILFCTCLPDLVEVGMNVIVECEDRLVEVLSRSFPTFEIRKENYKYSNLGSHQEDYDYHLPIGSLMKFFRNDLKKFNTASPIFKVNENLALQHEANLISRKSFKKRIGICWRSGFLNFERNNHYFIIEDLIPIFRNKNFDFINLQYDDCEEELLQIEKLCEVEILRWKTLDLKNDIDSVISLISRLDLVITVDTAIAPIAASIGKSVLHIGKKGWNNLGTDYYPFFPSIECISPDQNEMISECIPRVNSRLLELMR
jgi:Flp pilus assembly protein TadD